MSRNLLLLRGGRQDKGRISTSSESLIDRNYILLRYAVGLRHAHGGRDDVVVKITRNIRLDRIRVEPKQIDIGIGGCKIKDWTCLGPHVLLDHERLSAWNVSVDPVSLSLQVGGGH